jgi:hypothetical protein
MPEVRFTKIDTTDLTMVDDIRAVYLIVDAEDADRTYGYVASGIVSHPSPSVPDRVYRHKGWAGLVHLDELKSGLQLAHNTRKHAARFLTRHI